MRKLALLLFLLIVSTPALSSAQIREESFDINPFAGYCISANSPEFCHKTILGLRLGYNITKNIGIEASYNKVSSTAKLIGFDALYHILPDKQITPFIVAGIGYGHIEPKTRAHYDTMMGDVGAGVKISLTDSVAIRSEIRDVLTHSNNVIVSAGLVFSLGGKVQKSAPPAEKKTETPAAKVEPKQEPKAEVKPETIKEATVETKKEPGTTKSVEAITVVLEDVHFAHDSSALTKEAKELLARDIQKLKTNPGISVEIQGHTSAIGSDEYNMKLSIKRANTVRDYLVNEGVAENRLTAKGYGETKLEVAEPKPKKESKAAKSNRRVHFEIIVK